MARYHQLSIGEKQALHRERMREPSVVCPACETQTTASDLLGHIDTRCPGPREPNPHAHWISFREALALGVSRATLSYWAKNGNVRYQGVRQDRRYLLRDLAQRIAKQRANRRR